jgi:hypothetical protein
LKTLYGEHPAGIPWFLKLDPQVFQTDGVTGSKVRGKVFHRHAMVENLLWTARR